MVQISNVMSIGIVNRSFSIAFWVRPQSLVGRLVHVSGNATGFGWCIPFMGFAANGSFIAQLVAGASVRPVFGPAIPLAPNWTHIVQTWSLTNGLRLYINSALAVVRTTNVGSYAASSAPMYVTLGNSLGGATHCAVGLIGSPSPFTGDMDEFRIYGRELTPADNMKTKSNRRVHTFVHSFRASSEQPEKSLFKVVRKKHLSSAKSMVVIHAKIRPYNTSPLSIGRKHIKEVDTFPSINDLLKKIHSRRNSSVIDNEQYIDSKQSSNIDSQPRGISEQSSIRRDRSSKTIGKHSLRSWKILPKNELNCHSSIQFNSSSRSKILDNLKIEQESIDGLHDIVNLTKKRKRKKRWCTLTPCALFCLLGLLLAGLVLGIVLAILLVRFLPQSTTMKTSSSSSSMSSSSPSTSSTTTTVPSTSSSPSTTTTVSPTSSSSTTTTVSPTSSSSSSSSSTTTVSPTTSSTTTSTTTTVHYVCNSSCVNQSWISTTNLLAKWEFDNNLIEDVSSTVSTADQSPTFVAGYANDGLLFDANTNQSITSPAISLGNSDFTIDAWIYPTGFPNPTDHSIIGICPTLSNYECLYLTVRQSTTGYIPYFGLLGDECSGNTNIILNQWVHIAFVFDSVSLIQSIYVDGVLDANRTALGVFKANSGPATIGHISLVNYFSGRNYFQGIIDRVQITARVKSSCEILEDATLSAYFTFDSTLFLTDSGPNSLPVVRQSVAIVSVGHLNQAISFNSISSSYFQISSVTSLGITNRPFSISFWVRPQSLVGTLVHVSTNASGLGWCMPFLGFHSNGSLVAQMYNGNARSTVGPTIPLTPAWTHIVETWAPVVGIRLYINNVLVSSTASMAGSYTPNSAPMYVTLANSLSGTSSPCDTGLIGSSNQFLGDMDDFRIYSRALTIDDICHLYTM